MNKFKIITAILFAIIISSCVPIESVGEPLNYIYLSGGNGVARIHDDEKKVTCWLYNSNGISCIPDYMIEGK